MGGRPWAKGKICIAMGIAGVVTSKLRDRRNEECAANLKCWSYKEHAPHHYDTDTLHCASTTRSSIDLLQQLSQKFLCPKNILRCTNTSKPPSDLQGQVTIAFCYHSISSLNSQFKVSYLIVRFFKVSMSPKGHP